MTYWTRVAALLTMLGAAAVGAACGTDDTSSTATLPPIATTTTTTTIPPTTTTLPEFYVIQKGDTLFSIAELFHVDMATLQAVNEITNPNKIYSGLKIRIPQPGVVVTVPSTVDPATVDPAASTPSDATSTSAP